MKWALRETNLPRLPVQRGKVRDNYSLGDGRRLIVTTDRLSAFDQILAFVPFKGQVLTELAAWWFDHTSDVIPNHLIAVPDANVMLVREAQTLPVEMVVRGFLTGVTGTSLWTMYQRGERHMYGHTFPEGLRKNIPLPQAVITPTTKADHGAHDAPLAPEEVVAQGLVSAELWGQMQDCALALFARGQELAAQSGLILVDTKYEFGVDPAGNLMLIDEIHTPDSSRYWRASTYEERLKNGLEPENFDKEYLRLWFSDHGYRGEGEPPSLPGDIVVEAGTRYIRVYEGLTGRKFEPAAYPAEPRIIAALRRENLLK
jgi:phosphoribosylaminoimidazole-succinocarboxamide synthase